MNDIIRGLVVLTCINLLAVLLLIRMYCIHLRYVSSVIKMYDMI